MLTGESIPIDKSVGEKVSAATINRLGFIKCQAEKVGDGTTLAHIIKLVSDATSKKAPIAKAADRVSGFFVPTVLIISIITFIIWLVLGKTFGFSLERAISVLVISCPCALGLATPVAIMVGTGVGAKNGILFKSAEAAETVGKANFAVLDKTGTITKGKPEVTDIIPVSEGVEQLVKKAYSIEIKSEHPLSLAIVKKAEEMKVVPFEVTDFEVVSGSGVKANYEDNILYGGKYDFISKVAEIPQNLKDKAEVLSKQGKTVMYFAENNNILGIVAVSDTIKDDSKKAIEHLKKLGIKVVMLTGDNKLTANAVADEVGIEEIFAEVLPDDKEKTIKELQKKGKVIMVGDGINDAPALASADVGIAIGAGTDVAIDAAEIVLMNDKLSDVSNAVKLGRAMLKNIYENLFWAFIYNVIGIPLAAGVFMNIFGWKMTPMLGAAAMSLSSVCVVSNALRLNLIRFSKKEKDNKIKKDKENEKMVVTLKIDGMMCPHCEARVKKSLEALDEVKEVTASHEKGTAEIVLNGEVSVDTLKKVVTEQGYEVLD